MNICLICSRRIRLLGSNGNRWFRLSLQAGYSQSVDNATSSDSNSESSDEETSKYRNEDYDPDEQLRTRLLSASLQFVPEMGWTKKAIIAGAELEGLPAVTHGLAPGGGIDLVHFFYTTSNQQLAQRLATENDMVERGEIEKKSTTKFIRDSLEIRLRMLTPYVDTWPQAMGLMAVPQNTRESLKNLSDLLDDIWYYAGDRSVDMNWYTKRLSLGAVYKSTELFMIQDKSADFNQTWQFMDRRLDNLSTVGKTVRECQTTSANGSGLLKGIFVTTRNILGMNDRAR